MADVTSSAYWLTQANAWATALEAVQNGRQYTIGNRQLALADSVEIRQNIDSCMARYNRTRAAELGAKSPGVAITKWT